MYWIPFAWLHEHKEITLVSFQNLRLLHYYTRLFWLPGKGCRVPQILFSTFLCSWQGIAVNTTIYLQPKGAKRLQSWPVKALQIYKKEVKFCLFYSFAEAPSDRATHESEKGWALAGGSPDRLKSFCATWKWTPFFEQWVSTIPLLSLMPSQNF